jgi:hypothetical protein
LNGTGWDTTRHFSFTYDAGNNKVSEVKYGWGPDAWDNYSDSLHYYYSNFSGIINLAFGQEINIYPNPSSGTFTLQSTNHQINNSIITISNMLGDKCLSLSPNPLNGTSASFDVSELSNGIYFVQLKTNDKTITKKLLLSK